VSEFVTKAEHHDRKSDIRLAQLMLGSGGYWKIGRGAGVHGRGVLEEEIPSHLY
jgi:hypothetical protein